MQWRVFVVAWICAGFGAVAGAVEADKILELEKFPVCEASAVLPCPTGGDKCLLVGDNEQSEALFAYQTSKGRLKPAPGFKTSLGGSKVSDIEALASLGNKDVLIMGSHSRNTRCEPKENRRRFLVARYEAGRLVPKSPAPIQTERIRCQELFGDIGRSQVLRPICDAIDAAEEQADAIVARIESAQESERTEAEAQGKAACNAVGAFNIEGTVGIPRPDGPEIWVGLRSPLVDAGASRRHAALLRLTGTNKLSFDAGVLLDLGGRGIRELTTTGGWLWGIAGPMEDRNEDFHLWRFPLPQLQPGITLKPEFVRVLPPSSEGLVFQGADAYVIIDGDLGDGAGRCATPARYIQLKGILKTQRSAD
jgi:hypothetical protein